MRKDIYSVCRQFIHACGFGPDCESTPHDKEVARKTEALIKIASCKSVIEGDVIDIAQKALGSNWTPLLDLERCPNCNTELSTCGEVTSDEPRMDCLVCLTRGHLVDAISERDTALSVLKTQQDFCRHWIKSRAGWCNEPADFILWGKLVGPDDLGPRCEKHLAKTIPRTMIDQCAVVDLRGVNRILSTSAQHPTPSEKASLGAILDAAVERGEGCERVGAEITDEDIAESNFDPPHKENR